MNFFGGGQPQPQGPDPVFAAKTEMEVYTGAFPGVVDGGLLLLAGDNGWASPQLAFALLFS